MVSATPVGSSGSDLVPDRVRTSAALWVAACGLVIAAVIHALVIPEHFREFAPYGWFFTVLCAAQLLVAFAILKHPDDRTVGYVVLASVCIVALWLVSRTTGLPTGPEPWQPKSYGVAEVVASCAESITALGCLMELWTVPERRNLLVDATAKSRR